MTPSLILDRPDARRRRAIGDDGLTDSERLESAERYRAAAARPLSESERDAVTAWLAGRGAR